MKRESTGDVRCAILTVSDRAHAGTIRDASGPALARIIVEGGLGHVEATAIVPDEEDAIRAQILAWVDAGIELILCTGGTGFAPRDRTPEAVASILDRPAPGLMELARMRCLARTPMTFLSRGVAGLVSSTIVITLPGSPTGACEQLEALLDVLPHAIASARGGEVHK